MNPVLLLSAASLNKRLAIIITVTMVAIVSTPMVAVFALGQGTLSYLAETLVGSDSTSAISTTTVGLYEGPDITGDTYAWGNCTYWVYALRLQAGDPIPTSWGNAATWAPRALLDGYVVNDTPSPGAIMQTANSAGGLGHVAYVTAVDPTTGAWTISEMNVKGLDVVDITTYPAAAAANYNFIHDKGGSL
ncbi:MAG TPA: CHAP domain-containing protein [Verrucomicrobiae bacterium]|nr:CHAP domain-containing protein [Verrucomicrobiae bacterium]